MARKINPVGSDVSKAVPPVTAAPVLSPAEELAALRARLAALEAAPGETVPAAVSAVGAAQKAQDGPALTGPPRLVDTRPEGHGQAVYLRDLPTKVTFSFTGKPDVALTLEGKTFSTGSVGAYGCGKIPVVLADGRQGALQCSLNLPLCKPKT